jgi:hypothetical protein
MQRTVLLMFVLALAPTGVSTAGPKEDVTAATQAWADAFNGRDPERILALYDPCSVGAECRADRRGHYNGHELAPLTPQSPSEVERIKRLEAL